MHGLGGVLLVALLSHWTMTRPDRAPILQNMTGSGLPRGDLPVDARLVVGSFPIPGESSSLCTRWGGGGFLRAVLACYLVHDNA